MTRSTPGPNPVPAPARPRTDPRCFIVDALRIASHHVTPSCHTPLHDARERIMEHAAPRGPCGFSYLPYRPPYCIKGPVEPRSKISLVIEYHHHEILPTPHCGFLPLCPSRRCSSQRALCPRLKSWTQKTSRCSDPLAEATSVRTPSPTRPEPRAQIIPARRVTVSKTWMSHLQLELGCCYDSFHAQSQPGPCVRSTPDRSPTFHRECALRHVTSCDPLPSCASARRMNASWYARPLEVRAGFFLPAL